MRLATASPAHARSIAEIYREAFPESIELFFPRKPRERLLRLLALSFALLFGRGAKGAVALDEDGRMAGYLLYSTSKGQARGSLLQAVSLLARMALGLGPVEMLKLMTNQLLMMPYDGIRRFQFGDDVDKNVFHRQPFRRNFPYGQILQNCMNPRQLLLRVGQQYMYARAEQGGRAKPHALQPLDHLRCLRGLCGRHFI